MPSSALMIWLPEDLDNQTMDRPGPSQPMIHCMYRSGLDHCPSAYISCVVLLVYIYVYLMHMPDFENESVQEATIPKHCVMCCRSHSTGCLTDRFAVVMDECPGTLCRQSLRSFMCTVAQSSKSQWLMKACSLLPTRDLTNSSMQEELHQKVCHDNSTSCCCTQLLRPASMLPPFLLLARSSLGAPGRCITSSSKSTHQQSHVHSFCG